MPKFIVRNEHTIKNGTAGRKVVGIGREYTESGVEMVSVFVRDENDMPCGPYQMPKSFLVEGRSVKANTPHTLSTPSNPAFSDRLVNELRDRLNSEELTTPYNPALAAKVAKELRELSYTLEECGEVILSYPNIVDVLEEVVRTGSVSVHQQALGEYLEGKLLGINSLLQELDDYARDVDPLDYGLPRFPGDMEGLTDIVKKWLLGENNENN